MPIHAMELKPLYNIKNSAATGETQRIVRNIKAVARLMSNLR